MEKTRITHEVKEVVEIHELYDVVKYTSVTDEYVKYADHVAEMREVLFMLADVSQRHDMAWRWDAMSMVSKYSSYLGEK